MSSFGPSTSSLYRTFYYPQAGQLIQTNGISTMTTMGRHHPYVACATGGYWSNAVGVNGNIVIGPTPPNTFAYNYQYGSGTGSPGITGY